MPSSAQDLERVARLIAEAQHCLVVSHAHGDGDAVGASLALAGALRESGRTCTVLMEAPGSSFSFLPGFRDIQASPDTKNLLVVFDESQGKIGNLTLRRLNEHRVAVVVTTKEGVLNQSDIKIEEGTFPYDLIISLDASGLSRLGSLFTAHPDLFAEVPILNIDHHRGNELFGIENLVDIQASSTCEQLVDLLEVFGSHAGADLLTKEVATCLLTGILTDTGSFQNSNVTPRTLTAAAKLQEAGADRELIVRKVYQEKSLAELRLWGRALAYLKEEPEHQFVWTAVSRADFVAAQAPVDVDLSGFVGSFLKQVATADFGLVLYERDGNLKGSFRSNKPSVDVSKLAEAFGGGGHPQAAAFLIEGGSIKTHEQEVVNTLRSLWPGKKP